MPASVAGILAAIGLLLGASDVFSATIVVPPTAEKYRRTIVGVAHREFGLNAEVSRLAAQIHQESGWREGAVSPVGARGLTQFMPRTADGVNKENPELRVYPIYSPIWAINAQSIYMRDLLLKVRQADTDCDRWALGLRMYNGGPSYIHTEQKLATRPGNAASVAEQCYRKPAACKENREYPDRIMRRIEPAYIQAGWGGSACYVSR